MKKLFLACALSLGMSCLAIADDTIVPTIHGAKTSSSWLFTMGLANEANYVAFQMDVKLPVGLSACDIMVNNRLKDGSTTTIDGQEESTDFVVEKNLIDAENNIVRIIGYNLGNHSIQAGSAYNDALFKMTITSDSEKAYDDASLATEVSNVIFVKEDGLTETVLADCIAVQRLLGDVNLDKTVDTKDGIQVINSYLEQPANADFDAKAADVNNDGVIDTKDKIAIINVYLSK